MYQFDSIFVEGSYMDVDFDGYLLEDMNDVHSANAGYFRQTSQKHASEKGHVYGKGAFRRQRKTSRDHTKTAADPSGYHTTAQYLGKDNDTRKKQIYASHNGNSKYVDVHTNMEKKRKEHERFRKGLRESVFDSEDPQYYESLYEGGEGYDQENCPTWHEPEFKMTGDDGEYEHKSGSIPSFVDADTPNKDEQNPAVGESFLDFELI